MSVKYDIYKQKIQDLQNQKITPEEFLQDYVNKNPDKGKNIQALLDKGISPNLITNAIVYGESHPSLGKEFTSSFVEAGSDTMALLDTLVGRLTGSDYFKQRAQQWRQQAQEYSNPETPSDIFEAKNLSQAAHSGARMAGSLAEFLLETALGGTEGKIAKAAVDKLAEGLAKKEIEKTAAETAAKSLIKPETIGAFTQITAPEVEREYEAGGEKHPLKALVGGALIGALYTASPFEALKALNPETKPIADSIAKLVFSSDTASKIAASPAINSLKQGIEQSLILGTATATSEYGSNQPISAKDIGHTAALGGLLGALTGALSKTQKPIDNTKLKEAFKEELQTKPEEYIPITENLPVPTNNIKETKYEQPYNPEEVLNEYKDKLLSTPKKDDFRHITAIKTAFDKGLYSDLIKKEPKKAIKVLNTAGYDDLDILEKYGSNIKPEDYSKKMATAVILGMPNKNTIPKITVDNIDTFIEKGLQLKEQAPKNKNIGEAINDIKQSANDLILKEANKLITKSKISKDKVKPILDDIDKLTSSRNDNKLLGNVIKAKALLEALPKTIKDIKKREELKAKITSILKQKLDKEEEKLGFKQKAIEDKGEKYPAIENKGIEENLPAVKEKANLPAPKSAINFTDKLNIAKEIINEKPVKQPEPEIKNNVATEQPLPETKNSEEITPIDKLDLKNIKSAKFDKEPEITDNGLVVNTDRTIALHKDFFKGIKPKSIGQNLELKPEKASKITGIIGEVKENPNILVLRSEDGKEIGISKQALKTIKSRVKNFSLEIDSNANSSLIYIKKDNKYIGAAVPTILGDTYNIKTVSKPISKLKPLKDRIEIPKEHRLKSGKSSMKSISYRQNILETTDGYLYDRKSQSIYHKKLMKDIKPLGGSFDKSFKDLLNSNKTLDTKINFKGKDGKFYKFDTEKGYSFKVDGKYFEIARPQANKMKLLDTGILALYHNDEPIAAFGLHDFKEPEPKIEDKDVVIPKTPEELNEAIDKKQIEEKAKEYTPEEINEILNHLSNVDLGYDLLAKDEVNITYEKGTFIAKSEKSIVKGNKKQGLVFYVEPPPELSPAVLKTLDSYLENAGFKPNQIKDIKEDPEFRDEITELYEARKEQVSKGISVDNMKSSLKILSWWHMRALTDGGEKFKEKLLRLKLNDNEKKIYEDLKYGEDSIHYLLKKHFGINVNKAVEQLLGKDIAKRVKVKSIDKLTLEDLGGRKMVEKALLQGYKIFAFHLTDSQLLDLMKKRLEGATLLDKKAVSAIILMSDKNLKELGTTFYHEIFHTLDELGLIPEEDLRVLKDYLNKKYGKNDTRAWYEKAADEFALFAVNKKWFADNNIIHSLFAKVSRFINAAILKIHSKLGIKTEKDVFRKILLGEQKPNAKFIAYLEAIDTLKNIGVRFKISKKNLSNFEKRIIEFNGRTETDLKRDAIEKSRTALEKVKDFILDFGRGIAPELTKKGLYLYAETIRRAIAIKQLAHTQAYRALAEITRDLNPEDKFLMEKHLIIEDMFYNLQNGIQTFHNMNEQWGGIFKDVSDIAYLRDKIKKEVDGNEKVKAALKRRAKIHNELLDYLYENGYIGKREALDPSHYFHRITAAYFNGKIKMHTSYMGRVPITDPLRERVNSAEPYITDYIYSDYEALAQFYLLKNYDGIIKRLSDASEDVMKELIADYVKAGGKIKEGIIPDVNKMLDRVKHHPRFKEKYRDYTALHIEDIPHFYTVWSMSDDLMGQLLLEGINSEGLIDALEKGKVQRSVAIRKFKKSILIHNDVLAALRRISEVQSNSPISKFMRYNVSLFKKFVLFSPFRLPKYTLDNFSSDVDIVLAYAPKILFEYSGKAFKDLHDFYYNKGRNLSKEVIDEIKDAEDNLVLGTNITSEEVYHINNLEDFRDLLGLKPSLYQKWWNISTKFNNFRESILRLAAYRYYKEALRTMKLEDIHSPLKLSEMKAFMEKGKVDELAAKLAREVLGDYGNLSSSGKWIRDNLIPFWSWIEVNMPRYFKLFRHMYETRKLYKPYAIGSLVFRMAFLYTAINMFNFMFFPQISDTVNNSDEGQLHLILGVDKDGTVRTMRLQGALSDALDWFYFGGFLDFLKGRKSGYEFIKEMPMHAVSKIINSSMPIQKTIIEDIAGITLYPDADKPRIIRDKIGHFLQLYGLGLPYKILFSGEPHPERERGLIKGILSSVESSVFYTTDLNSVNYTIINKLIDNYLNTTNQDKLSIYRTQKSIYAFYYKRAIQYGDKNKAIHFLAMYYLYGGTLKTINKSILKMNPLTRLKKAEIPKFLQTISEEDRYRIKKYNEWFNKVMLRKGQFSKKDLLEIYHKAYKLSLEMKKAKGMV